MSVSVMRNRNQEVGSKSISCKGDWLVSLLQKKMHHFSDWYCEGMKKIWVMNKILENYYEVQVKQIKVEKVFLFIIYSVNVNILLFSNRKNSTFYILNNAKTRNDSQCVENETFFYFRYLFENTIPRNLIRRIVVTLLSRVKKLS